MANLLSTVLLLSATLATALPASDIKPRSGCPPDFKNVVFNSGYQSSQFSQIPGASNWLTFGIGTDDDRIPMMAFASDVAAAVSLVNSANPPEYLLTFNEPDYSYMGFTPTMSPQDAANAIQPLLASPGPSTKFIAPVTADPESSWLPDFFAACNCQSFFHAYNIHVYLPDVADAESDITNFHNKFADKPVWVTEIAPGNANPACSLSFDTVSTYMNQIYRWGASTGWVERIFWNTGNEIPNDNNVCNSYLLDTNDNPSPLLATFNSLDCSGSTPSSPLPPSSPPPPPPPPPAPAPAPGAPTSPQYGQCGGINWTGATQCTSGTSCQVQNPYYSQCL